MKLWGGRFKGEMDKQAQDFQSSLRFDQRLWRYDIQGSIAHAEMLGRQGVISSKDAADIIAGLKSIAQALEKGELALPGEAEDVHTAVEALLTERIGSTGGKLHTGRSRNDQVALDLRMYVRDEIGHLANLLMNLEAALLSLAEAHAETIMPGYTHLRKAQPVTLGHHLLAYVAMFERDLDRLKDCYRRTDVSPLGAAALAGSSLPLDKHSTARALGFAQVAGNTIDAVSDRDFVLEFLGDLSLVMVHLSRLAEELILWSTEEFGFIEWDDRLTTGSSLMPQKKNPDIAELVRAKAGRVFGHQVSLLTVMKALPLAYNKDLQEDKEALFDAVDTVESCLRMAAEMIRSVVVRKETMLTACSSGFMWATELADYLVMKGVPFREAHAIVGRLVLYCYENGIDLKDVDLKTLASFSPLLGSDVYQFADPGTCVRKRDKEGEPSPEAVKRAIGEARKRLAAYQFS